jgi:protein-tyrosine phosphatase
LHCAAGVHRTGTIAYTLMRLSGHSDTESLLALKRMREETWKGVGAWRIELAENLLVKFIVIKAKTMEAVKESSEEESKSDLPETVEEEKL